MFVQLAHFLIQLGSPFCVLPCEKIGNKSLIHLASLQQLSFLSLNYCSKISNPSLHRFLVERPKSLKTVSILDIESISGAYWKCAADWINNGNKTKNKTILDLSHDEMSTEILQLLIELIGEERCANEIEEINFKNCCDINLETLELVADKFTKLKKICLVGCEKLSYMKILKRKKMVPKCEVLS